jgi:hypothetical protein
VVVARATILKLQQSKVAWSRILDFGHQRYFRNRVSTVFERSAAFGETSVAGLDQGRQRKSRIFGSGFGQSV